MFDRSLPSPEQISASFGGWPENFGQNLSWIKSSIVFNTSMALEYLERLVPLLNINWEICYASADLSKNKTIDEFYNTIFRVLRRVGARFDWSAQLRPWQFNSGDMGSFRERPRAVTLFYHRESVPNERCWVYKEASLPGYIHFDPRGYAGWSKAAVDGLGVDLSAVPLDKASAFYDDLYKRYVQGALSKYFQGIDGVSANNYVFFPLQIIDDTVHRLAYIRMLDLAQSIMDFLPRNGINVVFKRHPLCSSKDVEKFLDDAQKIPGIYVSNSSIHKLIGKSQGVVTVNSGVGFESLLQMKPVFFAGRCDYGSVAHELRQISDIAKIITFAGKPIDEEKVKKFLYVILNLHQCRSSDESHVAAHLIRTLFLNSPT